MTTNGTISIEGLDKAELLAALYNKAKTQGLGFLAYTPEPMMLEEAQQYIAQCQADLYFDYLKGRVMKVDLNGDTLKTYLYNRDNGDGAAERIVEGVRIRTAVPR